MCSCHLRLVSQTNVLVDKDGAPHLAGLGNAYILPGSTAWIMEGGAVIDRVHAPEPAVPGMSPAEAEAAHPSKVSDVHDFGLMAFEVRMDSF